MTSVAGIIEDCCTCLLHLLGIKASQQEIKQMLIQAGADESGEVGYDAFVQIMTAQLLSPNPANSTQRSVALSFDSTVNEYRRCGEADSLTTRSPTLHGRCYCKLCSTLLSDCCKALSLSHLFSFRKKIIAAVHERDKVLLGMLSANSNKAGKHLSECLVQKQSAFQPGDMAEQQVVCRCQASNTALELPN